jgi:hypothetical protein
MMFQKAKRSVVFPKVIEAVVFDVPFCLFNARDADLLNHGLCWRVEVQVFVGLTPPYYTIWGIAARNEHDLIQAIKERGLASGANKVVYMATLPMDSAQRAEIDKFNKRLGLAG